MNEVKFLHLVSAELATLKHQYEQLRAAAQTVLDHWQPTGDLSLLALRAALDAPPAEPVRKFAMGAIAKPESPVQVGYVVQAEPTPLPAWDQSDGVECPNCGGNATLCSHDGLAEPACESARHRPSHRDGRGLGSLQGSNRGEPMTNGIPTLTRYQAAEEQLAKMRAELATLKRQHEQLVVAAIRAADIASGIGCSDTDPEVLAEEILTGLNAALDAPLAPLNRHKGCCENDLRAALQHILVELQSAGSSLRDKRLASYARGALDAISAEPETHPVSKQASEPICYECKNSADQRFCKFCS